MASIRVRDIELDLKCRLHIRAVARGAQSANGCTGKPGPRDPGTLGTAGGVKGICRPDRRYTPRPHSIKGL